MRGRRVWSAEDDATLREAGRKGWSVQKAALRLRRSKSAVKTRAAMLRVTLQEPARLPGEERLLPRVR
jgi:hypothetical protein